MYSSKDYLNRGGEITYPDEDTLCTRKTAIAAAAAVVVVFFFF